MLGARLPTLRHLAKRLTRTDDLTRRMTVRKALESYPDHSGGQGPFPRPAPPGKG